MARVFATVGKGGDGRRAARLVKNTGGGLVKAKTVTKQSPGEWLGGRDTNWRAMGALLVSAGAG